jgi:hypothetical protein
MVIGNVYARKMLVLENTHRQRAERGVTVWVRVRYRDRVHNRVRVKVRVRVRVGVRVRVMVKVRVWVRVRVSTVPHRQSTGKRVNRSVQMRHQQSKRRTVSTLR